jgi:cell wall-associated NlpC family hydrolase
MVALAFGLALMAGARADENGRLIPPRVVGMDSSEIRDFHESPEAIRDLLERALALTRQNLGYRFGSSDPALGGMDCSGTIFHLLRAIGIDAVPRSAEAMYQWVRKSGTFRQMNPGTSDSRVLASLRPGDLLFWSGTYAAGGIPSRMS